MCEPTTQEFKYYEYRVKVKGTWDGIVTATSPTDVVDRAREELEQEGLVFDGPIDIVEI